MTMPAPGSSNNNNYYTNEGFNNTPAKLIDTPLGKIKGMHLQGGNSYGGTHTTVYGESQRISWDTDAYGKYIEGSLHIKSN